MHESQNCKKHQEGPDRTGQLDPARRIWLWVIFPRPVEVLLTKKLRAQRREAGGLVNGQNGCDEEDDKTGARVNQLGRLQLK